LRSVLPPWIAQLEEGLKGTPVIDNLSQDRPHGRDIFAPGPAVDKTMKQFFEALGPRSRQGPGRTRPQPVQQVPHRPAYQGNRSVGKSRGQESGNLPVRGTPVSARKLNRVSMKMTP